MSVKTIQKKRTRITLAPLRRKLVLLASICATIMLMTCVVNDLFTTIDLIEGINEAEQEKIAVTAELEHYQKAAVQLNDTNFIAHRARVEHELIKKGEVLFRLPALQEKE